MQIAGLHYACDGIHFVVPVSWIELSLPLGSYLVWKKGVADYGDLPKNCQSVFRSDM
jgi:hypothetical protein